MSLRHFIDLHTQDTASLRGMLEEAKRLKAARALGEFPPLLQHCKLAMVFEKNSTRTRVSFEAAMLELGGHALPFSSGELQLGRGETVADTARALSCYVDAVMLRCHAHATLEELAEHAHVPVINGLSDASHPCQILADVLTLEEEFGTIAGRTLAWVGDGNNVANTLIEASAHFGFHLKLACPAPLQPAASCIRWSQAKGGHVMLCETPAEAVRLADAVFTDTWVSMGDSNAEERMRWLAPYRVDDTLMAQAHPDAVFLHCLPAHRGEEVTAEVIDGPQSRVWQAAENRLHAQKAVLLWCMGRDAAA